MPSHRISVRVPRQTLQRLQSRSRSTGARESEIVRAALETYLAAGDPRPTVYDLAKEAGLVGCVPKAPRDLSTNKRHMKGFGKSRSGKSK